MSGANRVLSEDRVLIAMESGQGSHQALATLLWGLDLVDHGDYIGIASVPDALASAILDIVTAAPPKRGMQARRKADATPRTLPLTWRPPALTQTSV